jgi:sarcosine/dimethylglycine N-methyltransferase
VKVTRDYYDSSDADSFYYQIWGGEDIHVGIYQSGGEPIFDASQRTVQKMLTMLPALNENTKVLDLGAGYGGAARYLAREKGCTVWCYNLSDKENERNKDKNKEHELDHLIHVRQGNFEKINFEDETFDVIWSEDALLHSNRKGKVFEEAYRVLKPGGNFIFTDPMQSDDCPKGVLQPILDRIHLEELGAVKHYRELAQKVGFKEAEILEMPDQLVNHYRRVLEEIESNYEKISEHVSDAYIEKMKKGLQHWINGGKNGYLNWGILHFQK